ncbi:MAG: Nramp family divalent metal transporter, partial [Planctomycetota bacterium]|nr:Nramp family divalent metal transporter [Planctomycetota bacterium]
LVTQRDQDILYRIRGSFVDGEPEVVGFAMIEDGRIVFDVDAKSEIKNPEHLVIRQTLIDRARELGTSGGFYVQTNPQQLGTLSLQGDIRPDGAWHLTRALMSGDNGDVEEFGDLQSMPEKKRRRCENILKHVGNEDVHLVSYFMEHKRIPPLDWMILAAFASYAGAGGFANTLFSNFARDKGWGMGSKVGAIPSAVGGTTISLSHVGMKFDPTPESMGRWRGWMRWVLRDQLCVWMICATLGVALPCLLSLEFVRNAPVSQDRVSAMMADGMKNQYPMFGQGWWYLTLLIGFLILFPGQVVAGDGVARRWTDILWTVSGRLQSLPGRYVKYIYYGILIGYAIWGIFVLTIFRPLMLVKISGALGNLAIGFAMLHTIYVNRTLLPRALRPYWFVEVGMFLGSMFFLGISGVVAYYTFR